MTRESPLCNYDSRVCAWQYEMCVGSSLWKMRGGFWLYEMTGGPLLRKMTGSSVVMHDDRRVFTNRLNDNNNNDNNHI